MSEMRFWGVSLLMLLLALVLLLLLLMLLLLLAAARLEASEAVDVLTSNKLMSMFYSHFVYQFINTATQNCKRAIECRTLAASMGS